METGAPSVWALGECAGSPQFTHVAVDDFRIVRDNLNGGSRTKVGRQVSYCMYTDPPMARIGLGENEASAQGIAVRVAKLPVSASGRARTLDKTAGLMKAVVSADSDDILGFAMIGPDAGEVLAVMQMAMLGGMPFTAVRDAVITHLPWRRDWVCCCLRSRRCQVPDLPRSSAEPFRQTPPVLSPLQRR